MTADTAATRVVALPDLGEGLPDAEIVAWRLAVGDRVHLDEVLVEVETAKAAIEVPCPYAGVIAELHGAPGDTVPVGGPLVTVIPESADDKPVAQTSPRPLVGYGVDPASDCAPPPANGSGNRVPVASPLVRKAARDAGVVLGEIRGTGPGGLVTRGDVDAAVTAAETRHRPPEDRTGPPDVARPPSPPSPQRRRRATARKVALSRREIPDATCWLDVDATGLVAARAALAPERGDAAVIGVTALLARMTVAALRAHPRLNGRYDVERDEPVPAPDIHLGVAVHTDTGLQVPVVRHADRCSTRTLAERLASSTADARAGRIPPADLTGSTFTLNNYGVHGVDTAAPILNYPEAGMLGIGRIARRPWVVGDGVLPRPVVRLSVTFDHRMCDGADAARFLRSVAECVEQPVRLLRWI